MYYETGNTLRKLWVMAEDPPNRTLKHTGLRGGKYVSTVALWSGKGFESMVFGAHGEELETRRYGTMLQALAGHEDLCVKWAQSRAVRRRAK